MTNSNLVTVFNGQIANQSVQLCNARELHTFGKNLPKQKNNNHIDNDPL